MFMKAPSDVAAPHGPHGIRSAFYMDAAYASSRPAEGHEQAKNISVLWVIPFVGILLSIAIIPLVNGYWWHHNFAKISLFWGLPTAIAMIFVLPERAAHTAIEYMSFIALVGSLFVISGGILVRGAFKNTPATNVAVLAIGSVMASLVGTAGASMILVRPMLRINATRKSKTHIFVFFIFIVSNIGGSLTPLGDPPLFLGLLQGVPFSWTFANMLPGWAFMTGCLLTIFYFMDTALVKKEGGARPPAGDEKFAILGGVNFIFLFGVLAAVVAYGSFMPAEWGLKREAIQMVCMAAMAGLSMAATPKKIHEENGFSFFPVREVATLFAAIFACMIPALDILEYMGSTGRLGVSHPWQFFWMTGGLSSFLDNAPTYMTFLSLGKTLGGAGCEAVIGGCVPQDVLRAISMGAVFMGANTYIGNAPNFMVKSICHENEVELPSFVHYMGWSIAILIPLFALVTLIFFR